MFFTFQIPQNVQSTKMTFEVQIFQHDYNKKSKSLENKPLDSRFLKKNIYNKWTSDT